MNWQYQFKVGSFACAMLSAVCWFVAAVAAMPPVPLGHWAESPVVKKYRETTPAIGLVNAIAALLTGLSVALNALAEM